MSFNKEKTNNFWNNINGEMKVFVNEYNGKLLCATNVVTKQNEEWFRFYIDVNFPKDNRPTEKGMYTIKINRGFISCYATKDGEVKPRIFIQDFDVL